jgi:hypothetical protein
MGVSEPRHRITTDTGKAAPVWWWLLDAGLSSRAIHLYALLDRYADWTVDEATVSRKTLAEKLGVSTDTLDRVIKELVVANAVEVVPRYDEHGDREPNGYHLLSTIPGLRRGGRTDAAGGGRTGAAPNTQIELLSEKNSSSPKRAGRAPTQVNGKKVTADEEQFAIEVLDAFNEITGKKFAAKETLGKIIRSRRDHPELDVAAHRRIIEQQIAAPWWTGDVSPSVIYGNGPLFDRAVNGTRGGRTADQDVHNRFKRFTKA